MRKGLLRIKTLLALVAITLTITSCQKSTEVTFPEELPMQTVTITAGISSDNDQTKTYIGDEVTEGEGAEQKTFRKVYWSAEDKIGVVVKNADGEYLDQNGAAVTDIDAAYTFEFAILSGQDSEDATFSGTIPEGATIVKALYPYVAGGSATIDNYQAATPDSFDPNVALMEATRNDEGKLVFKHKAAYVKLTTDFPYSRIILCLNENYTIASTEPKITPGTYYIAVPAATYDNFSLQFEVNGGFQKKSSTKPLTLTNGKIMNLGKISRSDFPITDLGSSETANCYIVTGADRYKFPTVQGNTSTSVGSVASVEVLWETFGTATAPAVGDLVNNISYSTDSEGKGYIIFDATDKKGNALIAAKDADGKILWSWHIWMTDNPQDTKYGEEPYYLQDRNLGATSAAPDKVEALGLFYQWGRKDPFLGAPKIEETYDIAASTLDTWPTVVSNSTNGTIDYAQANPTTYICYEAVMVFIDDTNGDWFDTGTKYVDDTRWSPDSKTKYDPCPPGYKVPSSDVYGHINMYRSKEIPDKNIPFETNAFDFSTMYSNSWEPTGLWYQLAGQIYGPYGSCSIEKVTRWGCYWTNSHDPFIFEKNALSPQNIYILSKNSLRLGDGASVRCSRE